MISTKHEDRRDVFEDLPASSHRARDVALLACALKLALTDSSWEIRRWNGIEK